MNNPIQSPSYSPLQFEESQESEFDLKIENEEFYDSLGSRSENQGFESDESGDDEEYGKVKVESSESTPMKIPPPPLAYPLQITPEPMTIIN